MAKFTFNGIDTLEADFKKLEVVDDETSYGILEAGAEELLIAWRTVLHRMGLMNPNNPQLINSLSANRRIGKKVTLTPKGKRKDKKKAYKRMKKENGKRRSSGSYQNTNAEIGYILEYGSPRIKPRHWMEIANEEGGDACTEAMQEAWNKHLDDLNL
jgi:hypothetical protein